MISRGRTLVCGSSSASRAYGASGWVPGITIVRSPACTLKFAFSRDFEGFDPGKVTDSYVGFLFLGGIYDSLVSYTPDYQVATNGIQFLSSSSESWTEMSSINCRFTSSIRAMFSDRSMWRLIQNRQSATRLNIRKGI